MAGILTYLCFGQPSHRYWVATVVFCSNALALCETYSSGTVPDLHRCSLLINYYQAGKR